MDFLSSISRQDPQLGMLLSSMLQQQGTQQTPMGLEEVNLTSQLMGTPPVDEGFEQFPTNPDGSLANVGELSPEEAAFIAAQEATHQSKINEALQKVLGEVADTSTALPTTFDPNAPIFGDSKDGVDRVNYYSADHGVTASRDPKTGRATLTNIGADGKPTPASQKFMNGGMSKEGEFNPMNPVMATNIDALMQNLSQAPDSATAEGIARSLNVGLAEEATRIQQEVFRSAEIELGVPQLRNQIEAMQRRDASVGMIKGVPFSSPEYQAAVTTLAARQRAVAASVEERLSKNLAYNRLQATQKNAQVLVTQKINRLGQAETSSAARQEAAEIKAQAKQEQAAQLFASIPEYQRDIIYRLDPTLKGPGKEVAVIEAFERNMKNKGFEEFVNSPPTNRLQLALKGNMFAFDTVAEDEAAITGRPAEQIKAEIQRAAAMEPSESMINAWAAEQVAFLPVDQRKEQIKVLKQDLVTARMATTNADKARYAEVKNAIVAQNFRANKTQRYLQDVNEWGSNDPELQAAVVKAKSTTGQTSIDKVFLAFADGKSGPEAIDAARRFKDLLRQTTSRDQGSILGAPDEAALVNAINNTIIQSGTMANWIRSTLGLGKGSTLSTGTPNPFNANMDLGQLYDASRMGAFNPNQGQ